MSNHQTQAQAQANLDALFNIKTPVTPGPSKGLQEPGSRSPLPTIPAENGDVLAQLPIQLLIDFPTEKHPFHTYTPEEREAMKDDVIRNGILQPIIVRPHPTTEGHYQIIAGHNRRTGAADAGYTTVPCIIRQMSDDAAQIQLISSNLKQRLSLLPSEKAFAYKLQLEAMKRQGYRTDLTCGQVGTKLDCADENATDVTSCKTCTKLRSDEAIAVEANVSARTIQNYIRLTYLTPYLLKKVDERKLPLTVGATLSYLSPESQRLVENFFFEQRTFPITQNVADKLRELEQSGTLTAAELERVFLSPPVVRQLRSVKIKMKKWRRYFDDNATETEVIQTIEKALKAYFEKEETA